MSESAMLQVFVNAMMTARENPDPETYLRGFVASIDLVLKIAESSDSIEETISGMERRLEWLKGFHEPRPEHRKGMIQAFENAIKAAKSQVEEAPKDEATEAEILLWTQEIRRILAEVRAENPEDISWVIRGAIAGFVRAISDIKRFGREKTVAKMKQRLARNPSSRCQDHIEHHIGYSTATRRALRIFTGTDDEESTEEA